MPLQWGFFDYAQNDTRELLSARRLSEESVKGAPQFYRLSAHENRWSQIPRMRERQAEVQDVRHGSAIFVLGGAGCSPLFCGGQLPL